MKKITLLSSLLLVTAFVYGQQSYSEVITNNTNQQLSSNQSSIATIIRVDNGKQPIIDTYTTIGDFDAAVLLNCTTTVLASEDFTGGPAGITDCGTTVSSAGDGCFLAGELEAGFDAQASNGTTIINIPPAAIGNVDSLIGATTFAEFTIINFSPDVYAVSMDIWENNDPTTDVRVFGAGGTLIDSFLVNTPTGSQTFFGIVADEPITKIELEGQNGSGELFGNFQYGADCSLLSVNDNLASLVSVFPNPATSVLNIKVPSNVEINSAKLFDVLGKNTGASLVNGTMNTANLARGVYLLNIKTSAGTLTQKVVKE